MSNAMLEESVARDSFFALSPIGGGPDLGSAKLDAKGIAYTLVKGEWKVFPGGRVALEDSFDLREVPSDPSIDIANSTLPPRRT